MFFLLASVKISFKCSYGKSWLITKKEVRYPGYHLVKSTVLILDKVILSLDLSFHIFKIKELAIKIFKANQLWNYVTNYDQHLEIWTKQVLRMQPG